MEYKQESNDEFLINASGKRMCEICNKKESSYTCPKCNICYCTLDCYRNVEKHLTCSENFYHDQIVTELKQISLEQDMESKNKMARILLKEAKNYANDDNFDHQEQVNNETDETEKQINEEDMIKAYETKINEWKPWWRNDAFKEPLLEEINDKSEKLVSKMKFHLNLIKNSSNINVSNASKFIYNDILQISYFYVIIANIYQLNENDFEKFSDLENIDTTQLKEIVNNFIQLENMLKNTKLNQNCELNQKFDLIVRVLSEESNYFLKSYVNKNFLIGMLDELIFLVESPEIILHVLSKMYNIFDCYINIMNLSKKLLDSDLNDKLDAGNLILDLNEEHSPLNVFHYNKTNYPKKEILSKSNKSKRVEIIRSKKTETQSIPTTSNFVFENEFGKRDVKIFMKKYEFFFKWLSQNKQNVRSKESKQTLAINLKEVKETLENELKQSADEKDFFNKNLDKIRKFEKNKLIEEIN